MILKGFTKSGGAGFRGFPCFFSSAGAGGAYGAEKPALPSNTARSAISIEADTGKIFYSKNLHYKRDPLSTTKLLTCLVALEHLKLGDTVTVTQELSMQVQRRTVPMWI